ncbi:MAG: gliding motility-associated C-terminal domain-containing protein, partial [Bacteroidota bacterium]
DSSDQAYTAEASHIYGQFGTYSVRLIASNGSTCADTLVKRGLITYADRPSNLFVPTAFTPNDDGRNDVLRVRGQFIVSVIMQVYNEWGEEIFSGDGIQGWDGRYQGKLVQPDTYVYTARVTLADGSTEILQGKTTVIR